MSLANAIYSRLSGYSDLSDLVGARIYPQVAPASAASPYIVFQRISTPREHSSRGPAGLVRPRVQVDCYGATQVDADNVSDAVRHALDGFAGTVGGVRILHSTLVDEADEIAASIAGSEAHVYRRRMDFLVWHAETIADSYVTTASLFDGSTNYALRGSDLTGNANGQKGTFAAWLKLTSLALNDALLVAAGGFFQIIASSATSIRVQGKDAAGNDDLLLGTAASKITTGAWQHVAISWDLSAGVGQVYVDGADAKEASPTLNNDTIDYTRTQWSIGATNAGASFLDGCLGPMYLDLASYLDLSVPQNLQRLRSQGGKPVDLGPKGGWATGRIPIIYLPAGDPSRNKGSGGNFTNQAALAACSTSPTD